jgi:hypothetical protein
MTRATSALGAVALLAIAALSPAFAVKPEGSLYVLSTDGQIAVVHEDAPAQGNTAYVLGVLAGDVLVGIDVRPQNHRLYALGYNAAIRSVRLYHVDYATDTPRAVAVGAAGGFTAADGSTALPITASKFGIDFDPRSDRLRVVTDTGQNFRIDPNSGAPVDGDPAIAGVQMDAPLNGNAARADATAYSNTIINATATTQVLLDSTTNTLRFESPRNSAMLISGPPITLGGSLVDFTAEGAGLDIPPGVEATSDGVVPTGFAYASLTTSAGSALYRIELSSGVATQLGAFGGAPVRDVAVAELVPPALALSDDGRLHRFALDRPGELVSLSVTGISLGEKLVGIDLRPRTAQYYGLGVDAGRGTATLYRIDPQPGDGNVATPIGAPFSSTLFTGRTSYGFDFDPLNDRIRIVNGNRLNASIAPDTAIVRIDPLATTGVTASAYANNYSQPEFSTQFVLDPTRDALLLQFENGGQVARSVQRLTAGGGPLDIASAAALDIPPDVEAVSVNGTAIGNAYAALTVGGLTGLYRVALDSAVATLVGPIGNGSSPMDGLIVPVGTGSGPEHGFIVLTTTNHLAFTTESRPSQLTEPLAVQGLVGSDELVAIDMRPENNRLYGLGLDRVAGRVRLYHLALNGANAFATAVGTPGVHVAADGRTPVAVMGTAFGFDFNPANDLAYIVTNSGQNFQINPTTGILVDADATIAGTQMQAVLNGAATAADATAFTSTSLGYGANATQYAIDSASNGLYQLSPTGGQLTGGALSGVPDFGPDSSLDIPRGVEVGIAGARAFGNGYAVLTAAGSQVLYRISLDTRRATRIGAIDAVLVRDIAVVPLASTATALVADGSALLRIELARPGESSSAGLFGAIPAGERVVGIDIRPSTGQLYGLGVNADIDQARLYLLDPLEPNGRSASGIGVAFSFPGVDFGRGGFGFDFHPVTEHLRVVDDAGHNFRVDPDTGIASLDGALNGAAFGAGATAFGAPQAGATAGDDAAALYTLDPATDAIYLQDPPDAGTQALRRSLTLNGAAFNAATNSAFDIPIGVGTDAPNQPVPGIGYAVLTPALGGNTALYNVDLQSGAIRALGSLGTGSTRAEGLAVGSAPTDVALTVAGPVPENAGSVAVTISRSGDTPLVVSFATRARTAIAGRDYTAVAGSLYFGARETTKTVSIPILVDNDAGEREERLAFVVSGPWRSGAEVTIAITEPAIAEIFQNGFE